MGVASTIHKEMTTSILPFLWAMALLSMITPSLSLLKFTILGSSSLPPQRTYALLPARVLARPLLSQRFLPIGVSRRSRALKARQSPPNLLLPPASQQPTCWLRLTVSYPMIWLYLHLLFPTHTRARFALPRQIPSSSTDLQEISRTALE